MLDNEELARKAAAFKRDSRKEFDKAVAALIALAFEYRYMGADFLWDKDPELDAMANEICRNLSDKLAALAKDIAMRICDESLDEFDFDDAWDENGDGEDKRIFPILPLLDQQGSLLKELLEIWLALAFVYEMGQGELRVEISRNLANPLLSRLWKGLPKDVLKWGRGYPKNIAEQLAVIGQNAIVASVRNAEWQDAVAKGYNYYIRHRGSNYYCPDCDDLCGYPIPIEEPFEFLHSRCMCWPEYIKA